MNKKRIYTLALAAIIIIAFIVIGIFFSTQEKENGAPIDTGNISQDDTSKTNPDNVYKNNDQEKITLGVNATKAFLQQSATEQSSYRIDRLKKYFTTSSPALNYATSNINLSAEPAIYDSSCDSVVEKNIFISEDTNSEYVSIKCSIVFKNAGADNANSVKYSLQTWITTIVVEGDQLRVKDIRRW